MRQFRRWITVKAIADYCLVSRTTVRRWIKEGKLSAMKLPSRHYRVSLKDFRTFLERYDMPVRDELFEPQCDEAEFEKERR